MWFDYPMQIEWVSQYYNQTMLHPVLWATNPIERVLLLLAMQRLPPPMYWTTTNRLWYQFPYPIQLPYQLHS